MLLKATLTEAKSAVQMIGADETNQITDTIIELVSRVDRELANERDARDLSRN